MYLKMGVGVGGGECIYHIITAKEFYSNCKWCQGSKSNPQFTTSKQCLYKDEQLTQKKNADTEIDVTHPVFLSGVKGGGCVDQSLSKSTRLLTLFHLPERVGLGSQPALLNLVAQPTNAPSITFHFISICSHHRHSLLIQTLKERATATRRQP